MSPVPAHAQVCGLIPKLAVVFACVIASAHAQLVQQGPKLLGTGAVGGSGQGRSVALSSDGNTAIVGGDADNNFTGAAWVFTRSNGAWSQQQELTQKDGAEQVGLSVAISGDGNTALVGSNSQVNVVWLYTRVNGVWSLPQKLSPTGSVGFPQIGWSVALSGDGNTGLIGAPSDNGSAGAAWVFVHNNGVWSQQGNKLIGAGANGSASQGYSVALSADGNTAVVGGPADNFIGGTSIGAAWVFTRSNGAWDQGQKIVGNTTNGNRQGLAVAISGDSNTVLVSGPYGLGGVWVFVRNGSVWTEQAGPLRGASATGFSGDGTDVALNADGNIALIGGPGDNDALLFTRVNGTWTQQQEVTTPDIASVFSQFGNATAISADTTTFLIGAPLDNPQNVRNTGGSWAFVSPATTINAIAGTPQGTTVGTAFPTRLQTLVTNSLGYPAPGVAVTFTAPGSGPTGTFQGGSNVAAVVTNTAGVATVPPFTANRLTGPYTVTAAAAGIATIANFSLANIPLAVNVTLQTTPPNLLVSFDSAKPSAAPVTQQLVPGSTHTMATQQVQTSASGTQYSFQSWSDGQPLSHTFIVPNTDTIYTATFVPPPVINAGGIVNAASNAPIGTGGLAQGVFITIYGVNLGPATGVNASSLPLSPNLAGVTVAVSPPNGSLGPSLIAYPIYVSARQINAVLPSKTPLGLRNVIVNADGVPSQGVPIQVVSSGFGIFTANYGTGQAAIVDTNTANPYLSATNAARPGDILELFGTGLGPVDAPDNDAPGGAISPPGIDVQVVVGGQSIKPLYSGRSPQYPGEDQINFALPTVGLVAEGCEVSISVVLNQVSSNTATLPIASSGVCSSAPAIAHAESEAVAKPLRRTSSHK
jgi:uncharacterized protein (TIGR03437 family)